MIRQAIEYPRPSRPEFAPLQAGLQLHHIDRNPANNAPYNLIYLTPTEHRRVHNAKLTKEVVFYIRAQLLLGIHQRILASELHISGGTIRMLVSGHTWKDIQLTDNEVKQLTVQKIENSAVRAQSNVTLKGVEMFAYTDQIEKEVIEKHKKMRTGHFVQTYLPADVYRALHIRSMDENKTLRAYLEELITNFIKEGE